MGMGTGFTAGGLLPAASIRAIAAGARRGRRAGAGDAAAEPVHLAVHDADPGAGPRHRPRGADAQPPLPRVPRARRAVSAAGRSPGGGGGRVVRRLARPARGLEPDAGGRVLSGGRACSTRCSPRPIASSSCRSRTRAGSGWPRTRCCARARLGAASRCRRAISTRARPVGWRDGEDPDAVARRIRRAGARRERADPERAEPAAPLVDRVLLRAAGRHRRARRW